MTDKSRDWKNGNGNEPLKTTGRPEWTRTIDLFRVKPLRLRWREAYNQLTCAVGLSTIRSCENPQLDRGCCHRQPRLRKLASRANPFLRPIFPFCADGYC